jgi:rhomboid protease GluP
VTEAEKPAATRPATDVSGPEPAIPDSISIPPLDDTLRQQVPHVPATLGLITANCLVFLAMLAGGAGLWHSPNGVQLAWGANFGPATQDGEWWRLGTAMFLHFGVVHLIVNMWALWDAGRLVERSFGPVRFAGIYCFSGIAGNLLSLVSHHGQAVSGGASGAIFGVYGALLVFLWFERRHIDPREFRWLFWGALAFAVVIIALGLLIPGIDNAAHCGGLLAGLLSGVTLLRRIGHDQRLSGHLRLVAAGTAALALLALTASISTPAYRWRDEVQARKEISDFIRDDAIIGRAWQDIANDGRRGGASFDELADRLDASVGERYDESFEHLSQLTFDSAPPSAAALETLRRYAELRRDASRTLAEGLRRQDPGKIREAMVLEKRARDLVAKPSHPQRKPDR